MMRIPYMSDLVNFLANDPNIIAAGLSSTILLFSNWDLEKITNNWGDAILIIPGSGEVTSDTERRNNCKAKLEHSLRIGVQTRNPSSTVQHFVIDEVGPLGITGAFQDAALLEEILRKSISDFNNSLQSTGNNNYLPLTLTGLSEAESTNGLLVLMQEYKTTFIF